jgi:hypothetical protein
VTANKVLQDEKQNQVSIPMNDVFVLVVSFFFLSLWVANEALARVQNGSRR